MEHNLVPDNHIKIICEQLKIDYDKITNVYNYGSHVHGNPKSDSDYDLLIVGDIWDEELEFKVPDNPYFYTFEMKSINVDGRDYDIITHSNRNFERLLEIGFLIFVEVLFSHDKFRPIRKIDYKQIYLENWWSPEKLHMSLKNEFTYAISTYKMHKRGKLFYGLDGRWVTKKLFNSLRYQDTIRELIKTKTITDFGRFNDYKTKFLDMYDKNGDESLSLIRGEVINTIKSLNN